jgi:hypothetical protein
MFVCDDPDDESRNENDGGVAANAEEGATDAPLSVDGPISAVKSTTIDIVYTSPSFP